MARRTNAAINLEAEDDIASKVWKANPPGPEQKELNRMFQKGLIGVTDTPAKVRARFPIFMAFPTKTFALHFRTTKARYGLNAAATASSVIPELGSFEDEPIETPSSPDKFLDTPIEARNYPFMTWTYTDHADQKDFVCVVVPTVTGSRDIKFIISDDGLQLFVEYVWPSAFLDPAELFFSVDDDDGSAISMSHPMIYSYRKRMDELDLSEKSRPGASFVISFPQRVQRELGSFVKRALKCGDTRIIMLQFTGYQKKRVMSDADTSIKF